MGQRRMVGMVTNTSVMWSELSQLGELFDWMLFFSSSSKHSVDLLEHASVCFVLFGPQQYHHPPITLSCKQSTLDAVGVNICQVELRF